MKHFSGYHLSRSSFISRRVIDKHNIADLASRPKRNMNRAFAVTEKKLPELHVFGHTFP